MPTPSTLLMFTGAALLLAAMPGPGLFYVAGRTLASGRVDGLASCLGTAVGGLVHVMAGAAGVSALIMASASAFAVLKVAGGLYLLYLGIQTWRSANAPVSEAVTSTRSDAWRALRQGMLVEATNPKTAAFFLALIPQFLEARLGGIAAQFAVLGLISIALNTCMAVLVVGAASALRRRIFERTYVLRRLRQGSGVMLGGLGVSLLLARRPA
jgi:threonine/homoserine/homoserine lactone efflux protein